MKMSQFIFRLTCRLPPTGNIIDLVGPRYHTFILSLTVQSRELEFNTRLTVVQATFHKIHNQLFKSVFPSQLPLCDDALLI